jgi:hypothetical protein
MATDELASRLTFFGGFVTNDGSHPALGRRGALAAIMLIEEQARIREPGRMIMRWGLGT